MPHSASLPVRLLACAILATSLAGCVTSKEGWFDPVESADAAGISKAAASAIGSDMVAHLEKIVGPASTTFLLRRSGTSFDPALEQALKTHGYALAEEGSENERSSILDLSYAIDEDGPLVMVRLTTRSMELSRSYRVSATGAVPAGAMSVLKRASQV